MKKKNRIKSKREFDSFIKKNEFVKNSYYVIYYTNKKEKETRFGIAVGTSLGNAVTRNFLKRRVREIIKEEQNLYEKDLDYIIMVRKPSVKATYGEMKENLISLIKKVKK